MRSRAKTPFGDKRKKSNLHYAGGILPKRVTSCGAHLHGLAAGQHSSEETSQRWRVVGDAVSNLTGPEIETQTCHTDSDVPDNEV